MSCQCGAPPLPQKTETSNYAPLDKAFEGGIIPRKKGLTNLDKLLIIVIIFAIYKIYK